MNFLKTLSIISFILLGYVLNAQVAISTDGSDPHESAMLQVKSSDKGLLAPRMTTLQREAISNPAVGLLVFDTDTRTFWYRKLLSWKEIKQEDVSFITDADDDTRVMVEFTPDEDLIRFAVGGTEVMRHNGRNLAMLNIGNSIFLGEGAGDNDDLTNNWNVFLGNYAGSFNTTGSSNTAIGGYALSENTVGGGNIAIGGNSFRLSDSGNYNVAVGYETDRNNTGGSKNTIIGYQAGYGVGPAKKSGNIMIGYRAGYTETGDNKLYIQNTGSSDPLIYGEFDNELLRINGTLDINNNYQLPPDDGQAGEILKTDGSGVLSWAEDGGGGGGSAITDADDDTKVEVEATPDDDQVRFTVGGTETMRHDGRSLLFPNNGNSIFMGLNAGANDDLSNNWNTFIGDYSGENNTTGSSNIALSGYALYSNTTGQRNIAIGESALRISDTGSFNIVIGSWADGNNSGGIENVIIGYQAGMGSSPHVKSGNVFIGNQAGFYETGDNKLYIENSYTPYPLIYGEFDNDIVQINGTLNIKGNYSFPLTGGIAGQTLTSGGSGSLVWSWSSGSLIADGDDDTKVETEKYADEDMIRFTTDGTDRMRVNGHTLEFLNCGNGVYIGERAGISDSGYNWNVFVGYESGYSNTTGTANLGFGGTSLRNNSVGSFNTAMGNSALMNHKTGDQNTAIGASVLKSDTSGFKNTAIGYQSMYWNKNGGYNVATGVHSLHSNTNGEYNTAIGFWALKYNTTGDENTALGLEALYRNTVGNSNTAVGALVLYENTEGEYNTAVGYRALEENTTGDVNIAIGRRALASNTTGSNNIAIGENALKDNITGIYNTAIGYHAALNTNTFGNTAVGYSALEHIVSGYNNTALGRGAGPFNFDSLYNTTAIGYAANVEYNNQIIIGNSLVTRIGGYASWETWSDGRFKHNVKEDVAGLDFILKLRPVTYNYQVEKYAEFTGREIEDYEKKSCEDKSKIVYSGFIAQEVEKTAEDIGYDFSGIDIPESNVGHYSLRYAEFVVPLVKAVQEQQEQIENMKDQLTTEQQKFERLENLVISLQEEIEELRRNQ